MNELSKYTWEELNIQYTKYSERMREIEKYIKILPEKRPMVTLEPGQVWELKNDYSERLVLSAAKLDQKLGVIETELHRRYHLIGGIRG